jgi:nicotinate dehydrogenase subunit A
VSSENKGPKERNQMSQNFTLRINGADQTVTAEADTPLLYVLRNDAGLKSPKYGCGAEQCGACNIIVDGEKVFSCTFTVSQAAGKEITTLEGIGSMEAPHPIQKAFLAEQAAQCGYCTAGIIMSTKVLLDKNPNPDMEAIRIALQDNLCRCGTHSRVFRAVRRAAREMSQ